MFSISNEQNGYPLETNVGTKMTKKGKGVLALKPKKDSLAEYKRVMIAMWFHLTGEQLVMTEAEWKADYEEAKKSPKPKD